MIRTAPKGYLRTLGRVVLLLLLACFSLGIEETEQEWGGWQGTKSGPDSSRRGRVHRASSAAHHLHRIAGDTDDAYGLVYFDIVSPCIHVPGLAVAGAPAELLVKSGRLRSIYRRLNRGPPQFFL